MLDNSRLRIAMQKSGRLSDDSRELLARCGIKINLHTQRLIALAENMPIDILRVRDDDIPGLVMDGVVDLGIIGENVLEEELLTRRAQGEDPRYFTLRRLDFGGCRLSLATAVDEPWDGPAALDGKRIATSYPHLLKRYLDQKGVSFKSCLLNGSVEVAPRAGLADAICDLVSTGATLEANGLREVEVIYRSKACLIQRDGEMPAAKQQRFMGEYALSAYDARTLTSALEIADYFEAVVTKVGKDNAKLAANWMMGDLLGALNKDEKTIEHSPISASQFAKLLERITDNTLSGKLAKQAFTALFAGEGGSGDDAVDTIIADKGLKQETDTGAIKAIVEEVLSKNQAMVEEYKSGKEKAFNGLVGQVMKASRGKANPAQVNQLLKELIG